MKRLLIVSPHFPPVNAPDMQRVRMSLPYFAAAGWAVTVLTVDDPEPIPPLEPALMATVPPEIRVVRVRCFSRTWTRWLGVNNLGWRALPFLFFAGRRLLRRERFDLVYFSTTQFIVLPLGRLWRRRFGVPYAIDLQDPWLSDYYERPGAPRPPGGWKYRVARASARVLEGGTLRRAAHIFSVSGDYLAALRGRYAWFPSVPHSVLTFGAPERDLELVRGSAAPAATLLPPGPNLKIAYAGRLGADMVPALNVLFAALGSMRSSRGLEVYFFGTSYAPAGSAAATTATLAIRHGVQGQVHELPARIGYLDSLRLLLEADLALLLGSTDAAYSPSKIYPTLLAARPTVALVVEGSVLHEKLRELGGAAIVVLPPGEPEPTAAVAALREILARFAAQPGAGLGEPLRRDLLAAKYSAAAVASAQLATFAAIAVDAAGTASPNRA